MKRCIILTLVLFALMNILLAQNHALIWGTTSKGGLDNYGTLFHLNGATSAFTSDYSFKHDAPGSSPAYNYFIDGGNAKFYATTKEGGFANLGVLFEWDPNSNIYIKKANFLGASTGAHPEGALILFNNKMYGLASEGGDYGYGTIFEFDPTTNQITKKIDFDGINTGRYPQRDLILVNNKFYGMTFEGGINDLGTIFEWNPVTNILIKKIDFDGTNKGSFPYGNLLFTLGKFYGMTYHGGTSDKGIIFEWDLTTNNFVKKLDFNGTGGNCPLGSFQPFNSKLYAMTLYGGVNDKGSIIEWDPITNILVKKFDFSDTASGRYPFHDMVLYNNKFYGMTSEGGVNGAGTIFEWDPNTNIFIKKQEFNTLSKGSTPFGGLALMNNKFYGMTYMGGLVNSGTIFEWIPSSNVFTKRIDLNKSSSGGNPYNKLLYLNAKLYGTTNIGGSTENGTIFSFNPLNNTYSKLQDFSASANGNASFGGLTSIGTKVNGMTSTGGTANLGIIYEMDTVNNVITKKQNFSSSTGNMPYGNLTFFNNKFYGMTSNGGTNQFGSIFEWNSTTNTFVKKFDFNGDTIGSNPTGNLVVYNDKLYGLTSFGGLNHMGAIFEWDPSSNIINNKQNFDGVLKGNYPDGSMALFNNKFYGTTVEGGLYNSGVLFEWSPGTNLFTKKLDFKDTLTGKGPTGSLTLIGNAFYGMTTLGGDYGLGTLYKWNPMTNTITKIIDFNGNNGANPQYTQLIETFFNGAPTLVYSPDTLHVCQGSNSFATFTISDINFDSLSFNLSSSNQTLINNSSLSVSSLGNNNYRMDFSNNPNFSGASTISVTVSDGYNGTSSFSFVINVHPKPSVSISSSATEICEGDSIILMGTGASSYSWNNNISNNIAFYPSQSDTFKVIGTNTFGCSNTAQVFILVHPLPGTSASISGLNIVCQGQNSILYSIPPIANAASYIWTYPSGITGSSASDSIFLNFSNDAFSGDISVRGHNSCGNGVGKTLNVTINPLPNTPLIGTIIQPNCTSSIGSVFLHGLPPIGNWKICEYPSNDTIIGSGTSYLLTNINPGNYYYTVMNNTTCVSLNSDTVVIHNQPPTPTTPVINNIIQPTCTSAIGSFNISGLPITGNWTLNPGNISGTGANTSINGLTSGNYSYTVTNEFGCISLLSNNVTINSQPPTPIVSNQSISILTGSNFICSPQGVPPGTTYSWPNPSLSGGITGYSSGINQDSITGNLSLLAGNGTATYTITPTSGNCVGQNFTLIVTVSSNCTPVSIVNQPTNTQMCVNGTNAIMSIVPIGTSPFNYQWQLFYGGNWVNIQNGTPAGAVYLNSNSASLSISGISISGTYLYKCLITNCSGGGNTVSNTATLTVNILPEAPSIGIITQPTCDSSTGGVILTNLPIIGNWTINPGNINGVGASVNLTGLPPGTYSFNITDTNQCTSPNTNGILINSQPQTPTPPSLLSIAQPTCNISMGSITLGNLPTLGSWVINPGNIIGTGLSANITGLNPGNYNYTVTNASNCTSTASNTIHINTQPITPNPPSIVNISQPNCTLSTGTITLNNLPNGNWILNPGNIAGNGVSYTISGMAPGTFYYSVTNSVSCTSLNSNAITINPQPPIPTAPTVQNITQPNCYALGSIALSNLPLNGNWTLTRFPGEFDTTSNGSNCTILGLPSGNYTFHVTNSAGCTSNVSANANINTPPEVPTPPNISSISQPDCNISTGSVMLNNLPLLGNWVLTQSPGTNTIVGNGATAEITNLNSGTYSYTVTNAASCVSSSSANIHINTPPITPPTPLISLSGITLISDQNTGNQWYNENGPIPGATSQLFDITANGTYFDIVSLNGCNSDTSNMISMANIGIESIHLNNSIKIYPNPFRSEFYVDLGENSANSNLSILNMVGQVVFSFVIEGRGIIQTPNLAKGVYILRITYGNELLLRKIIKQ